LAVCFDPTPVFCCCSTSFCCDLTLNLLMKLLAFLLAVLLLSSAVLAQDGHGVRARGRRPRRDRSEGSDEPTVDKCAVVRCMAGYKCVAFGDRAECVPDEEQTDDDMSVCAAVTCPYGHVCVHEPKQCITTPCNQFNCVPVDEA